METGVSVELPKYKCHKEVHAAMISMVIPRSKGKSHTAVLIPADLRYGPIEVSEEYMTKHEPKAGGYYVVYEDGYKSFSPAEAFEGGYTRI